MKNKSEFINANEIVREKSIDEKKIEDFISTFNKKLKKHSGKALTSKVSINNGLDEIPTLTDAEFEEVKKRAATAGWIFTSSPDNYGTTSYHLEMNEDSKQNQRIKSILTLAEAEGYTHLRFISKRGLCGLKRFAFTTGLVIGLEETGYFGRYCFHNQYDAEKCLNEWNGEGDPSGDWIKYKGTGGERSNPMSSAFNNEK